MTQNFTIRGFFLCMALVLSSAISSPSCWPGPKTYREYLTPYEGMREVGYNRGPFIDSANRRYAYIGAPYCASSVSLILDKSGCKYPATRSGRAKAFINDESVSARRVWEGKDSIPHNSLIVFTRKGGGHIEFHISNDGTNMRCFGFNTSPDGKAGSQWNGTWSGYKQRSMKKILSPYNVFRVTHFTPVRYEVQLQRCCHNGSHGFIPRVPDRQLRQVHTKPYNRHRYSGGRAENHSPARYSIR